MAQQLDITVMAHFGASATFKVSRSTGGGVSLTISGGAYPSITLFADAESMARLRDELEAYLGSRAQAEAA